MSTNRPLKAGDQIFFLASMSVATGPGHGQAVQRGTVIRITDSLLDANRDRNGASWLDLVDDEQAQIDRWGKPMFGRGDLPEGVEWWNGEGDDASRTLARTLAMEASARFTHPVERAEEQKRIRAKFGVPITSRSGGTSSGWTE